ncbi:hypothetical protein F8388_001001 [Cannabis sativa]|uniref:CRAL/TRIO N-terminal domain-containing protein n=1 Tax=Cannabis sativa TaxID=3483 RepID=A0A7J6FWW5_CANSA|nr:hypothetical protein F8388_001001 [Cannabis sativa]
MAIPPELTGAIPSIDKFRGLPPHTTSLCSSSRLSEEKTAKQGPPKEEEKKKDEGEAKTGVKTVDQEASKVETEKEKEKVVVVVTEVASVDDDGAKTVEAIEESVVSVTPAPVDEASSSAKTETEEPKKEEEKEEQEVCVPPEEVSIWGIPLLADDRSDVTLLKFLKARDYKVKEAFTMLKNTVKWRKENGIDYLIEEDLGSDWDKVVFSHGVDKEGHAVCYNVFGEDGLHLTPSGNRIVFDEVVRKLMEEGLSGLQSALFSHF